VLQNFLIFVNPYMLVGGGMLLLLEKTLVLSIVSLIIASHWVVLHTNGLLTIPPV
jgi:hypothetical protein